MKTYYKIIILALCFLYWGYLAVASHMEIAMDAVSYQSTAEIILKEGWGAYFQTGPHREPLYPWLIAVSMGAAKHLSIDYTYIQKAIQLFFLFVTQVLALILLKKMNVRESWRWMAALYVGLSPAFVNSSLSLYSEIACMPFVLAIILLSLKSFEAIRSGKLLFSVLWASALALAFLAATGVKGIFQYIFIVFMAVFLILTLIHKSPKPRLVASGLAFILIASAIYFPLIILFKKANLKYNGQYVYTNRFDAMLYGNAVKRARPLTKEIFWSHIASIPGEGVCRRFFTEAQCRYCTFLAADDIYGLELPKLIAHVPIEDRNAKILELTKEAVKSSPGNYFLFMVIEGLRMFFWESTQIGFVKYPHWLGSVYDLSVVSNGLRLVISVLTMVAYGFLFFYVIHGIKKIASGQPQGVTDTYLVCLFIFVLTFVFIGGYSLYSTLTRFSLPIAPLFIVIMAFFGSSNEARK